MTFIYLCLENSVFNLCSLLLLITLRFLRAIAKELQVSFVGYKSVVN